MVSTPLLLANLKLLSVVNSDSQRTVTAALLHATHHQEVSVHLWIHFYKGTYHQLQYTINNCRPPTPAYNPSVRLSIHFKTAASKAFSCAFRHH